MYSIRVQAPNGHVTVHAVRDGETVFGRDVKLAVWLDNDRVSRRHAVLCAAGRDVTLTDLASRNGTYVNGRRLGVEAASLAPGDVIRIGSYTLVFDTEDQNRFDSEADGMREVLQKAPDETLRPNAPPAAGSAGPPSNEGLRVELEKKARVLALFYELSQTLGAVFSLSDVYDKALSLLLHVTPAARAILYQRTVEGDMQQASAYARGTDGTLVRDAGTEPLRISRTVFENVAGQRVSVLLKDTRRDQPGVPDSLRMHRTHSVMAAPILGRTGLLGVIYADLQDVVQAFSSDDVDLLNAVAVQTGLAIETVRTFEALRREAKAREKYQRFLPQQLVDDVMLDPNKEIIPGGTRQIVTVLFADLRGFTTLSESNAPEAVVELLNRFFAITSDVVFRHGGTLDKYIGDAVMALFGAPYATERDAVKGVRAAIEMQRAIAVFNRELEAAGQPRIGVGIGVNTGPAIVGFIGSDTRLDYTAVGDSVNVAARLEHLAKAGQILISEHTMQALDATVGYTTLDAVQVKGRGAKLQIAEVPWARD